MDSKSKEINEGLQHFHGSEIVFQLPLLKTKFTDGIKYLAHAAECFWLVTDTSVIAKSLMNKSRFITIVFKKCSEQEKENLGYEATIVYSDGNGNIYETHKYNITDFPLDQLRLFFVDDTLMLPSEY
ncbi:hypothetical protein KCTC52924_01976 [Arenibacter antarcticus]|uniref:DUF6876 family protein n=1 Tax=Arenibacter antarcticus TaxID=2040469 RepID=A0ABW5VCA4_9FLAO|nr:DUF6876 family protein [Arenibacter sp. H213]MCM4168404.1 hypothetical protein [Arenibacter sp. H213]